MDIFVGVTYLNRTEGLKDKVEAIWIITLIIGIYQSLWIIFDRMLLIEIEGM